MTPEQAKVLEFMSATGQTINRIPQFPSEDNIILRERLIDEEVKELYEANSNVDIVAVADALGDLLYVVLGTAVTYGINLEPVFTEIHRSNMTKLRDGSLRSDGKYIKGPHHEPAQLKGILTTQGATLS